MTGVQTCALPILRYECYRANVFRFTCPHLKSSPPSCLTSPGTRYILSATRATSIFDFPVMYKKRPRVFDRLRRIRSGKHSRDLPNPILAVDLENLRQVPGPSHDKVLIRHRRNRRFMSDQNDPATTRQLFQRFTRQKSRSPAKASHKGKRFDRF